MLGKFSESTCRLNFYLHRPDASSLAYSADAWGYGQISELKCLVIRETSSQQMRVLGAIIPRDRIPREDLGLMIRVHIVEEGLNPPDRKEWRFMIDEVDEPVMLQILEGPLIEPARLVGDDLHL